MTTEPEVRFKIGQNFTDRNGCLHTIIDIHKTYDQHCDLVKVRYVTQHDFLGQDITARDVLDVTIAKALHKEYGAQWEDFKI